jgi:hypothetical protein
MIRRIRPVPVFCLLYVHRLPVVFDVCFPGRTSRDTPLLGPPARHRTSKPPSMEGLSPCRWQTLLPASVLRTSNPAPWPRAPNPAGRTPATEDRRPQNELLRRPLRNRIRIEPPRHSGANYPTPCLRLVPPEGQQHPSRGPPGLRSAQRDGEPNRASQMTEAGPLPTTVLRGLQLHTVTAPLHAVATPGDNLEAKTASKAHRTWEDFIV